MHQVSCNRTTLDQDILKVNFQKGPGSMLKTFKLNFTLYDGIYSLTSLIVNNEQRDGANPPSL